MSLETMTKLATYTVGAGGAVSVTFSNIPQTYTDLVVRCSLRSARASYSYDTFTVNFNGSTTGYSDRSLRSNGSAASSYTNSSSYLYEPLTVPGATATSNTFGNIEIFIPNYTSNLYKAVSIDSVGENNATESYIELTAGLWSNTSAINSVAIGRYNDVFVQNSTITLYGVKNFAKSIGKVKASGGIISYDATYVTHTFNASGVFYVQQDVTPEVLVVAGGGGGGWSQSGYQGGGGGGGGLLYGTMNLTPGSYTVTVGSGGAGATSYSASAGGSGSNSVFNSSTALGGGGGGRAYAANQGGGGATAGASGGSGGGGAGGQAGGAATQGNSAGLTGFGNAGSTGADGAGGGAGGGAGSAATQSGYDVTAGIGKTYFGSTYAAGGGRDTTQGQTGQDASGTTNSGNGAGRTTSGTVTNGGSGIVIVRYKA